MTNANIIDGSGGLGQRGMLTIAGDRIESVVFWRRILSRARADSRLAGSHGDAGHDYLPLPRDLPRIAVAAKRLPIGLESPQVIQTLQAAHDIRLALESGYTGVVSAGAPFAIDAGLKTAI